MIRWIRSLHRERLVERRIRALLEERYARQVALADPPAHCWVPGGLGAFAQLQRDRMADIDLEVAVLEGWDDDVLEAYERRLNGVVLH